MKTPQQIKNEVEKGCIGCLKEYKRVGDKMIFDKIEYCKECEAKLSILTEYDKSIKEMIGKGIELAELNIERDINIEFNEGMLASYKQMKRELSKIGDNSEVEK